MITVRAYAKINLGLRILGNRPDGFHDIETVFHRVNIYDEMIVSPSSTLSLICTDPGIPTDEGNLSIRAAILLRETCHCEAGARIELRKKIPVGADKGRSAVQETRFWADNEPPEAGRPRHPWECFFHILPVGARSGI